MMTQDRDKQGGVPLSLRQGSTQSQAVQEYYDAMAADYDTTLAMWQYRAPDDACDLLLPHVPAGARVLDLGCGTGLFGAALIRRGAFVVDGLDISAPSLAQAAQRGLYARLIQHDLQHLPLPLATAGHDAAALVGVMSYVAQPAALMRDLCRVVRPGGMITFTQRTDFWQDRDIPAMIAAVAQAGYWQPVQITQPLDYIPGHVEFTDEIRVIHTLCRVS
jgi:predicted TPR repeat methyltransferase